MRELCSSSQSCTWWIETKLLIKVVGVGTLRVISQLTCRYLQKIIKPKLISHRMCLA